MKKLALALAMLAVLVVATTASAAELDRDKKNSRTVEVQILAVNDFHGNLDPPAGSSGRITTPTGPVDAGGVEYLATHLKQLEATNPNTVIVSAGDLIGASPLISGIFHDEPTIEAANLFGLDLNAVGNHEFDEGETELVRMQEGGCHPTDVDATCKFGTFGGADFQFLAANVVKKDTGETLFPGTAVKRFQGASVGFIGMTLEGTPSIVTPSGITNLTFQDEADTANAAVQALKRRGVEAIVVLIHEGGIPTTGTGYNDCANGISGPILDIVNRTSDEVDLFITGHTHQAYNCVVDGRPVTSAASFGRLVTDFDLEIERGRRDVQEIRVDNKIVTRTVPKDEGQTALLARYSAVVAPIACEVVGSITANLTRAANPAGESTLGNVIADAQLAATSDPALGGAVAAFMNPGGIRADLTTGVTTRCQAAGIPEAPGEVTFDEVFTVQPFGNNLVTLTLTGAQITTLLEQQFDNPAAGQNRVLSPSASVTYTWNAANPVGSRIMPGSVMINGVPVVATSSYRVTVNSFLADGGDNFSVLPSGSDRLGGEVDTDAFNAYLGANSPLAPPALGRITRLN